MKIIINGLDATLIKDDSLVQNSDKAYTVEFEFDESWNEYDKTVIFKAGHVTEEVVLDGNTCVIPKKCLENGGAVLKIGVVGTGGNEDVEVWCSTSRILYNILMDLGEEAAGQTDGGGNVETTVDSGVLIIHETVSGVRHIMDKTWQEIFDGTREGRIPVLIIEGGSSAIYISFVTRVTGPNEAAYINDYRVDVNFQTNSFTYIAVTADGYPTYIDPED